MSTGEDPIIVKPGSYPHPDQTKPAREGVCLVIDDGDTWVFGKEENGKITITIPSDGPWIAVPDVTEVTPQGTGKKKVAILQVKGEFSGVISKAGEELKDLGDEIKIDYVIKG